MEQSTRWLQSICQISFVYNAISWTWTLMTHFLYVYQIWDSHRPNARKSRHHDRFKSISFYFIFILRLRGWSFSVLYTAFIYRQIFQNSWLFCNSMMLFQKKRVSIYLIRYKFLKNVCFSPSHFFLFLGIYRKWFK